MSCCSFPRYMLITGITVLALAFFTNDCAPHGGAVDFEKILPLGCALRAAQGSLG